MFFGWGLAKLDRSFCRILVRLPTDFGVLCTAASRKMLVAERDGAGLRAGGEPEFAARTDSEAYFAVER
ncbi:hypothetical protein MKFW12EY_27110 [Methylomonas koyamae]|nr:hypothetical protein MKFW12EY_27110 [Methylomonas koyamae]